jgi:catechol 2,3-dioxygenase-like lactoylglutathione lyase family enzyme
LKSHWQLRHLGFIVRDLDKTVAYYQALGGQTVGKEWTMPARAGNGKLRAQFLTLGSLSLELFQPFGGSGMQQSFLDAHGEGIQHFAFTVNDIKEETDSLVREGHEKLFDVQTTTGSKATYFNTGKIGDILIELVQDPPPGTAGAKT